MFRISAFLLLLLILPLPGVENRTGTLGYGRIQTSLQDGKENVCFKAPGAGSKYRLGNECESWVELGAFQDLTFDSGIVIHNQVRPLFTGANDEALDFFDWGEFYSEVSNLFDNSVSFWIGRRFYKRYESHINDYWPLNMSGQGVGVDNLDLGPLTLSYALLADTMDPTVDTSDKETLMLSHDLRLLKKTDGGELVLFLNYITLEGRTFDPANRVDDLEGHAVGVIYKAKTLFRAWFDAEGENVSGIFYGEGLAKDAGEYLPFMSRQFKNDGLIDALIATGSAIDDANSWRIVNYNHFDTSLYGIMSSLLYEYRDEKTFAGLRQEWFSAGIRPYWFIDPNIRLLFEMGYDTINDTIANERYSLLKNTAAVELTTAKGVWERPVLRLFYTHAGWSQNAKGKVGTDYYADKTSGDNLGVQLEYWW